MEVLPAVMNGCENCNAKELQCEEILSHARARGK
jgi:hypothetical protein